MADPGARAVAEELLLDGGWERLRADDRRAIARVARRLRVIRNANEAYDEARSFGDRAADRVAELGGSWVFVFGFLGCLALWAMLNGIVLPPDRRFDPYPYIFLNLLLSMLAALQAPIIMMSQNRQADRDRVAAQLDYEVNLRAEAEIAALAAKLDRLVGSKQARWGAAPQPVEGAPESAGGERPGRGSPT